MSARTASHVAQRTALRAAVRVPELAIRRPDSYFRLPLRGGLARCSVLEPGVVADVHQRRVATGGKNPGFDAGCRNR